MKILFAPKLFLVIAATVCLSAAVLGQDAFADDARQREVVQSGSPDEDRPNLIRELELSPEQIRAVVRINRERKPLEVAARNRFRDAQRSLNEAIYADTVDETDVRAKLIEFQAAQADLARIKFMNELSVRKLLTPAQLVRFRDLRRRFAEAQKEAGKVPLKPSSRPLQRLRRRNLPIN